MAKTVDSDVTGKITAPTEQMLRRFETKANVEVSMTMFPNFMDEVAKQRGTWNKFLLVAPTSLGDCVCSEPTIRFVCETYKNCEITVATNYPELFGHLKLKEIIPEKDALAMIDNHSAYEKYRVCRGYYGPGEPQSLYFPNFCVSVVDYISLCMIRRQIPTKYKQPYFDTINVKNKASQASVIVHPGKTWPSRTIPASYWDKVIDRLNMQGISVTVIGTKKMTVDISSHSNVTDLRDETSILETIKLCAHPRAVLTNDSSVLHMAAAGSAPIGFFSTVKQPEYVTHWRARVPIGFNGIHFGYKMKNFAKWCLCDDVNLTTGSRRFDEISEPDLWSMLPAPAEIMSWITSGAQ